jgi:hypothetical protein
MLKCLSLLLGFFLSTCALGQIIEEDVYNSSGDLVGSVWTDAENWTACAEEPCPEKVKPVVCMEYANDCPLPISCRLEVSALLAEPFTGFVKVVTDVREEVVFYNQSHKVCFNFAKDEYNNWDLLDTSIPKIDCNEWDQAQSFVGSM